MKPYIIARNRCVYKFSIGKKILMQLKNSLNANRHQTGWFYSVRSGKVLKNAIVLTLPSKLSSDKVTGIV